MDSAKLEFLDIAREAIEITRKREGDSLLLKEVEMCLHDPKPYTCALRVIEMIRERRDDGNLYLIMMDVLPYFYIAEKNKDFRKLVVNISGLVDLIVRTHTHLVISHYYLSHLSDMVSNKEKAETLIEIFYESLLERIVLQLNYVAEMLMSKRLKKVSDILNDALMKIIQEEEEKEEKTDETETRSS